MPYQYRTNEGPTGGWCETWLMHADEENVAQAHPYLKDCLEIVGSQLNQRGDVSGAAKAALLHRHLFRGEDDNGIFPVTNALNEVLGEKKYFFEGVDRLGEIVDAAIVGAGAALVLRSDEGQCA